MSAALLQIETCLEASGQVEVLTTQGLGFVRAVGVGGVNGWKALRCLRKDSSYFLPKLEMY